MVNGYQKQTLKEDSGNAGSESGMTGKKHLNFGIESILQSVNAKTQMNHDNVKGLNDKCSSGVISSVFSNKVESSFLPGWYNRFWPVLHRENTTNLCKADIDINWQMKDAQRDKFCRKYNGLCFNFCIAFTMACACVGKESITTVKVGRIFVS